MASWADYKERWISLGRTRQAVTIVALTVILLAAVWFLTGGA
jgi:hypothetical protein